MADVTGFDKEHLLPDGKTALIRKLSWTQLKKAAKAQSDEAFSTMRTMGAELVKALQSDDKKADATAEKLEQLSRAANRKASSYEMASILLDGVISIGGKPAGTGEGQVDVQKLDAPSAESLHEAIVAYAWEVPEKNG